MNCSACGHENRPGAKFCGACAAALREKSTCSACGSTNPPGQKFCDECGASLGVSGLGSRVSSQTADTQHPTPDPRSYTPKHLADKILQSKSALEACPEPGRRGERKQVTVLFADVKGSMELAEQLDPEEWSQIMQGFFRILSEGVEHFEGFVDKFTGDGIMALFGAPIAHEDHAQRACYAALHLKDTLRGYAQEVKRTQGLTVSVRMGLNSGEVVVGKIGDDLRMEYTAQGHTVGMAARMERLASPDTVYLSAHTAALVSGYFQLDNLGPFTVKGVREPLVVYELQGVGALRTRLDVSRARGFSRFVGREQESSALDAGLDRALAGNGQVIGVVADAGTGKSRLCAEFLQRCTSRGIPTHEARGVSHGKAIPFLPVLQLFRAFFGITDQDSDRVARQKIAGALVLLDPQLDAALPLVLDFLGVPDAERPVPRMDPEVRQRQLYGIIKRVVHARSRREPVVVLIEDLHWIDAGSEGFLEVLADATPGARLLLLLNFRPEYHAAWMQRSHYQQLPLLPLGAEAITELLRDLLGTDPALADLAERIRARTGGNPFFIEETIQTLAESGSLAGTKGAYRLEQPIDTVALPLTVQAVLAARIDRLAEREKQVLQAAAVIGREFTESLLQRVLAVGAPLVGALFSGEQGRAGTRPAPTETDLAAALQVLVSAELIGETALYPEREYVFKHPLTQEVAYRSQLAERRARTHAAVGRAIEAVYAGTLDEQAALLAHHWEAAAEPQRAAEWHQRAAVWVGQSDRGEMLRHWREVRRLLRAVPESPETLRLGVLACTMILLNGPFAGIADEEARTTFSEGMELATRLGDERQRGPLLGLYGFNRVSTGAVAEGILLLEEGRDVADRIGDRFLRFMNRVQLGVMLVPAGRLEEAISVFGEVEVLCGGDVALGMDLYGFAPYVVAKAYHADALVYRGQLEAALHVAEQALEIARRLGDSEGLSLSLSAVARACALMGDSERALTNAHEVLRVSEVGATIIRSALLTVSEVLTEAGRYGEAIDILVTGLGIVRTLRVAPATESILQRNLADARLGAGEVTLAREAADRAIALATQYGARLAEPGAHLARARALLAGEDAAAAGEIEAALAAAASAVEATGARLYTPFIHVERAALARLRGDEPTRRRELTEAHRLFTAMGARARAESVARELA